MALVLCTGVDQILVATRKMVLEAGGHTVISITDENQIATLCKRHAFGVVVIGHASSEAQKLRVYETVRQHCPSTRVLEICYPHSRGILPGADDRLDVPVSVPAELLARVNALMTRPAQRRAAARAAASSS
jgi:DNA-binding response OmpR family regulator